MGKQLNNSRTSAKSYRTILQTFPPLLVNKIFVTDFLEILFDEFLSKQCTPVADDSTLLSLPEIPNDTLSSFEIKTSDIDKIMKALNVNRPDNHDKISIRMLKLEESVISELFYLIFKNCISSNTFLDVWESTNVTPVQKR